MFPQNHTSITGSSLTDYIVSYRFGFNGKEKDDEWAGINGGNYDFGARIYDSRVGRWLSVDKSTKSQPGWSPYKAFLDNPILYADPDGKVEHITIITYDEKTGNTKIEQQESNRIMTDGVQHQKDGLGDCWSFENYYYDYNTVIYRTIDSKGNVKETSTSQIIYDKIKDKDYVWSSGAEKGETKIEDWWAFIADITDIGGLIIYGSASSSESSPATPTKGKIWGSFDFAAFSELTGLISTVITSKSENTLSSDFSGTKAANLINKAKDIVESNKGTKGQEKVKCEFCTDTIPTEEEGTHVGPFTPVEEKKK